MLKQTLQKKLNLFEKNGSQVYFSNLGWLFVEKIFQITMGLIVSVWVARYLGPEQFGILSYAQSFLALFSVAVMMGLDGVVVREFIKEQYNRDELISTVLILISISSMVSIFGVILIVGYMSQDQVSSVLIFIMSLGMLVRPFSVMSLYFQAKLLNRYLVMANLFSMLVSSIIKILLIFYDAQLVMFAWAALFDNILLGAVLFFLFYVKSNFNIPYVWFNFKIATALLRDSWPYFLSGLALIIQARVDQIMLKEMQGNHELGEYSVALRLIEAVAFPAIILKNVFFPAIQNARISGYVLYEYRLLNFYRANFIIFLFTAIPIYLFSTEIVTFVFGREYQSAGALLALMTGRLFFCNMGLARGAHILVENLAQFSLVTMVAGTLTNIVLNYFWIPAYGAKGAILATLVSFFVTIYLMDFFYVKTRKNVLLQIKGVCTFYKISFN